MKENILKRAPLLRALKALRNDAINNPQCLDNRMGICYHVTYVYGCCTGHTYITLSRLFRGWPKHMGHPGFPIGDICNTNQWENEWLQLRIELLDYTIKKLNKMKADEFNELKER